MPMLFESRTTVSADDSMVAILFDHKRAAPKNAPSFDSEVGGVCTDARPWFYSIGQYRVFLTHAGLKLCTFKYDHTDLRHALLVTDKKQKKSTESRMWTRTW